MADIRIIYKSGAVMDLKCNEFAVTRNAFGDLLSVKWDSAVPEPLYVGVADIAAVWQLA